MSLITSSASRRGPTPSTRDSLVAKVCATYGFDQGDSDLTSQALDWLDEAVDEVNCALFEFNKTVEAGLTFTAGTNTVRVNTPYYRESLAYLVDSSNVPREPLFYYPWVEFQRRFGDTSRTGEPRAYSDFNTQDDGLIHLYPTPDTTTAANFTLSVEYYRRIPPISSVGLGNSILVPREVENAILYGARKRAAIHILGAGSPDVSNFAALEAAAQEKLRRVDRAHPDERKQFILSDFAGRGTRQRAQTDFWVRY